MLGSQVWLSTPGLELITGPDLIPGELFSNYSYRTGGHREFTFWGKKGLAGPQEITGPGPRGNRFQIAVIGFALTNMRYIVCEFVFASDILRNVPMRKTQEARSKDVN